jgi:hypothetical protein
MSGILRLNIQSSYVSVRRPFPQQTKPHGDEKFCVIKLNGLRAEVQAQILL